MPRPFDPAIFDPAIFDVSKPVPGTSQDEFTLGDGQVIDEFSEFVTPGMRSTTPRRLQGPVVVQIYGDAISLTAQVERSTRDPAVGANWAPAGAPITGNPDVGIEPTRYLEPSKGWWRLRVDAMDPDGSINVTFSSEKV